MKRYRNKYYLIHIYTRGIIILRAVMEFTQQLWIFTVVILGILIRELRTEVMDSPDLQVLRKRWGASEIVRDINHIKEDIKRISSLQDTGDISTNEALFYFLRMHDFDDNRKLDGHELIAAMRHSFEHQESQHGNPVKFEEIENIVDSFFAYDDNTDGYISYPELRKHLSSPEGNRVQGEP